MTTTNHTEALIRALDTLTLLRKRIRAYEWPECIMEYCDGTIAFLENTISNKSSPDVVLPPLPLPSWSTLPSKDPYAVESQHCYTIDQLLEYGAIANNGCKPLWSEVKVVPTFYITIPNDSEEEIKCPYYTGDQLEQYYTSVANGQHWQAAKLSSVVSTRLTS